MKRCVPCAALFAALAMTAPLSVSAVAAEPVTSSAIAHYIQNARTPGGSRGYSGSFFLCVLLVLTLKKFVEIKGSARAAFFSFNQRGA